MYIEGCTVAAAAVQVTLSGLGEAELIISVVLRDGEQSRVQHHLFLLHTSETALPCFLTFFSLIFLSLHPFNPS